MSNRNDVRTNTSAWAACMAGARKGKGEGKSGAPFASAWEKLLLIICDLKILTKSHPKRLEVGEVGK